MHSWHFLIYFLGLVNFCCPLAVGARAWWNSHHSHPTRRSAVGYFINFIAIPAPRHVSRWWGISLNWRLLEDAIWRLFMALLYVLCVLGQAPTSTVCRTPLDVWMVRVCCSGGMTFGMTVVLAHRAGWCRMWLCIFRNQKHTSWR